jgi:hypothetical protein
MIKRPVGRPKKVNAQQTKEDIAREKRRLYMKQYRAKLKQNMIELDKMEKECQEELNEIRQQRKKLIEQLDDANKQAESILKEAVGKKLI